MIELDVDVVMRIPREKETSITSDIESMTAV